MIRSSSGGAGRSMLEPTLVVDDPQQQPLHDDNDNLSEDDNAAPEMQSEAEATEKEDPLLLAIDDLEGRVVSALDDVKLHPGIRTSSERGSPNVHEELAILLRPVLEVAAHTGPSVARTYYTHQEGVEASCEDVYQRVVSDLVLPVVLEMAQSETIPAKRVASLEFFRQLWNQWHKPGSWLDRGVGPQAGPYGPGTVGSGSHHTAASMTTPAMRAQQKRRDAKRLAREGEILRYWVQASIACTTPGVFTSDTSEGAVASRGVISASASLRPSLRHIAQRIRDADDRGASRLFGPVMKMVAGVLTQMFPDHGGQQASSDTTSGDALRSACIKFLEIVVLCCSSKPQETSTSRRRGQSTADFSLEDLPPGHPVITREVLESIAEYAFTVLRGLTLMGGQVKVDTNMLSDMLLSTSGGTPSAQVVSRLKPAALAFLEIESSLQLPGDTEGEGASLDYPVDRSSLDFDFMLSQKSYALTINALSVLASNRPVFFKEAATSLARRANDPPKHSPDEGGVLPKTAVLAVASHLRSSCLTLLRNALSISTNSWEILHMALKSVDMETQADKALSMARQATALKTAGRAARNRANMYYEWDASVVDKRVSKRQRETDDALAKMRAAKAARGLGHGIQLPVSMVDSVELILANLVHLPAKRSSSGASKRKTPATLDFVVDAILTNGASLAQDEGRWYDRDGGTAWKIHFDSENRYEIGSKLLGVVEDEREPPEKLQKIDQSLQEQKKIFSSQCQSAASNALGRIVSNSVTSRSKSLADFGCEIAARLAWTLQGVEPSSHLQPCHSMATDSIASVTNKISDATHKESLKSFVESFPLVASCLALDATTSLPFGTENQGTTGQKTGNAASEMASSLSNCVINEAFAQSLQGSNSQQYERSLDVFVSSVVHASERANDKPSDNDRKKVASQCAASLQRDFATLPSLPTSAITLACGLCDIEDITKKAAEAARKSSQQTIAASAAAHAAKVAAEKRATTALLALRDAAFQRSAPDSRRDAVGCAVGIAAGRLPASASIEDKALKLVMNKLFRASDALADAVVEAAVSELERASTFAVENFDKIKAANEAAAAKAASQPHGHKKALQPASDEEKHALEHVRKPVVLVLALCVRRQEIIKRLFSVCGREKADVLSKALQINMSKLARAAVAKDGSASSVALKIADMVGPKESPLLLSFLENLVPATEKTGPPQDFIDACHKIQETKLTEDGKKDPRFIIPVLSGMKRTELIEKLVEFMNTDDKVFLAALVHMGDRVGRHALLYREEPDPENPSLRGLTVCEQLVCLHNLDFVAAGLPQKRYLDAIRLCLDNDEVFNDRLVMSALDYMSGKFLAGEDKLPLAYMRTIILVCSKHESLHSWICHVLLPRLIEGKIFTDRRQWEGWMRCAKMLENTGEPSVSSLQAIQKLPEEQLQMYRVKYGDPGRG